MEQPEGAAMTTPRLRRGLLAAIALLLAFNAAALERRSYRVFIILDTVDDWSAKIRDGAKASLDRDLAAAGARAEYREFDTKIDPARVPAILAAIREGKPDLILMAVYPDGFADREIAAKLRDPAFRFVSADPIPVQIGLIKSWERPGGNVTGVGVFLPFNAQIKIARSIDPRIDALAFYSWDAMKLLNDWFEAELRRACAEEGIKTLDFRRVASIEESFRFYRDIESRPGAWCITGGISAYVHEDGSPANANILESAFVQENVRRSLIVYYDETAISTGSAVAGACVIWSDIGAQLAEKGLRILNGEKPGEIPWSYPRKYNLLINQRLALDQGRSLPPSLIGAAYRVYTDYQGSFTGRKD
jgi:putative ABC transport system substrate-binding protein